MLYPQRMASDLISAAKFPMVTRLFYSKRNKIHITSLPVLSPFSLVILVRTAVVGKSKTKMIPHTQPRPNTSPCFCLASRRLYYSTLTPGPSW